MLNNNLLNDKNAKCKNVKTSIVDINSFPTITKGLLGWDKIKSALSLYRKQFLKHYLGLQQKPSTYSLRVLP
jgi:hypothetical protein